MTSPKNAPLLDGSVKSVRMRVMRNKMQTSPKPYYTFNSKHCCHANTQFTSTEFTPTYVSQKVKAQMNSLNCVSDLARDQLNVLESNGTTSTHS